MDRNFGSLARNSVVLLLEYFEINFKTNNLLMYEVQIIKRKSIGLIL